MKPNIELHHVEGSGHWLATYDLQVPGFRALPTSLYRLTGDDLAFSKDRWDHFQAWMVEQGLRVKPQPGLVRWMRAKNLTLDPRQARSTLAVKLDALTIDGVPYLACHDKTPLPPIKRQFHRILIYWSRRARRPGDLQKTYDRLSRDFTVTNSSQLLGFLTRPAPEPSQTGRTTGDDEHVRIKGLDRRQGITHLDSGQIEILVPNHELDRRLDVAQVMTARWLARQVTKHQGRLARLLADAKAEARPPRKARLTDQAALTKQELAVMTQLLARVQRPTPGRYFPGHGRWLKALREAARQQSPEAAWLIFRGTHDVTLARGDDHVFKGQAFRYEARTQGPEYAEFDLKI